jgi:hypothetical protein
MNNLNQELDINHYSNKEVYVKIINFLNCIRYEDYSSNYDNNLLTLIIRKVENSQDIFCLDSFLYILKEIKESNNIDTKIKRDTLNLLCFCECYFHVNKKNNNEVIKELYNNDTDDTIQTSLEKIDKLMN